MTSMFKVLLFNFQKIHQKHMLWMGFLGMPKNILYKKKVVKKKKNVTSEQHLYVIQNLKVLCRAEDWNKRNEQGVTVMTQVHCYWHETKTRDLLFWIIKYNITLDRNLLQVRMCHPTVPWESAQAVSWFQRMLLCQELYYA